MKRRVVVGLAVAIAVCTTGSTVSAAPGPGGGGGTKSPPPQLGPITVSYESDGRRETTTTITYGSAFRNQGGSDGAPCMFNWLPRDADGNIPPDADFTQVPSQRWVFRETTTRDDGTVDMTDEDWDAIAAYGGSEMEEFVAKYGPVEASQRRFDVYCAGNHGDPGEGGTVNQYLGFTTVNIRDPFWGYEARRDEIRNALPWPVVRASSLPAPDTFGGLPVNMPAMFQINALPWGVLQSHRESYRGYTTQIVAWSTSVDYTLVFSPDDGPTATIAMGCISAGEEHPDTGGIPRRSEDIPDFAEPGQFDAPCVWIPPEPGSLSVTATVTYNVNSVVTGPFGGGYVETLAPEVRTSTAETLRVDTMKVVNVIGDED